MINYSSFYALYSLLTQQKTEGVEKNIISGAISGGIIGLIMEYVSKKRYVLPLSLGLNLPIYYGLKKIIY
jgi:hypothetical protein